MGVRLLVRAAGGQVLDEGLSYAFEQTRVVIGRGAGADVRLPHLTVSDRHAVLLADGLEWLLEDAASTNGTRVNGKPLTPGRRRTLKNDDRIEVGTYELSFRAGVLVTEPLTAERTAELARRLFRGTKAGPLSQPRLVVIGGSPMGETLTIPPPPARLLIGGAEHCQLVLQGGGVRQEHLEVIRDLDGVLLREAGAEGDAKRARRPRDGEEFEVGGCRLLFEEPAEESLAALASQPDVRLSQAPETTAAAPQAPPEEPAPTEGAAPVPRDRGSRAARAPGIDADLIIYALAAVVMAVSLAGLLVLMGD